MTTERRNGHQIEMRTIKRPEFIKLLIDMANMMMYMGFCIGVVWGGISAKSGKRSMTDFRIEDRHQNQTGCRSGWIYGNTKNEKKFSGKFISFAKNTSLILLFCIFL